MTDPTQKVSFGQTPFEIKKLESHLEIKINGAPDPDHAKAFEIELKKSLGTEALDTLMIVSSCSDLPKQWIRVLMQINLHAKTAKKLFRLVGVSDKLMACLKLNGVDSALKTSTSAEAALAEFKSPRK